MRVVALETRGVRNLAPLLLEPGPRFNVFFGDNGQGKTNVLEAIYVVAALRSFRTARLAELLQFGSAEALLRARVERVGGTHRYELLIDPKGRRVRLDGKAPRPLARYFGGFNVVLFAPEDLQLARGAPAERRRFLDRAVFNWTAELLPLAQDYEKTLKSRNALLREGGQGRRPPRQIEELLLVYDHQLAALAARVVTARLDYINELRPRVCTAFDAIARTTVDVSIEYRATADVASCVPSERPARYAEHLARMRAIDLARGSTSVGPHRDDLLFMLAGRDAGAFASQGQLRALMLAWKIAEMELLSTVHGEDPILLLDDVSSELDAHRNQFLFDFLARTNQQCFITTTHPRFVLADGERVDHEVRGGRIL